MTWEKSREDRQRDARNYGPGYRRNRSLALRRAGGRCEWIAGGRRCGSKDRVQVDHIIPVSQGGGHGLGNLRCLCRAHHLAKTAQEGKGYRRGRMPEADPPCRPRTNW